jgi:hypothetical protein
VPPGSTVDPLPRKVLTDPLCMNMLRSPLCACCLILRTRSFFAFTRSFFGNSRSAGSRCTEHGASSVRSVLFEHSDVNQPGYRCSRHIVLRLSHVGRKSRLKIWWVCMPKQAAFRPGCCWGARSSSQWCPGLNGKGVQGLQARGAGKRQIPPHLMYQVDLGEL